MNAVQAERAIHVADFAGLKQSQFAAADRHQIRDRLAPAANAVLGMAARADILLAHLHFERRKCGSHKVKLSDGANELAERSVLEKSIHHEHGKKVGHNQPGRPPRRRPQIEQLVSKQDQDEKTNRKPLIAQRSRPGEPGLKEASRRLTHQHEGAGQAEKISRAQQHQHQHAAKVKPAQGCGQILRRQRGPEQSVQDHDDAEDEQRRLKQRAGIPPAEQMAQARHSHQIERKRIRSFQGRDGGWIQQLA